MSTDYDVIVVGAGFAGATAARECATRGLRTLVLEGRDRIGGRTWTTSLANGEMVDIGGTYIHWSQPHVWAEVTRYGLEAEVVPADEPPEISLVPSSSGLQWVDNAQIEAQQQRLFAQVFQASRDFFPLPFDPLNQAEAVTKLDQLTIKDWLDRFDLDIEERALLSGWISFEAQRPASEAGIAHYMQTWAMAGGDPQQFGEAMFTYRLRQGITSLLTKILHDGGAEVKLESPVRHIQAGPHRVKVTTSHAGSFSAAGVVVATPTGVWPYVEFSPPLAHERIEAAREGMQAPRASKTMAVIKGESRRIFVTTPEGHAIGQMWTTRMRSHDEQILSIFSTHFMRDPSDHVEVTAAIRSLLPDVEVVELVTGVYGIDEEFSRGAWPYRALGQLSRFEPYRRFAEMEERIAFATSDIAAGWCGFIDGAIESGLRAGRQIRQRISHDSVDHPTMDV